MEEQKKDILDIIDDGIQEAYRLFRMEELEKGKVIKRDPMLEKIHKGILKAYQHIPAELEYERKQKEKLKESQS
jgi:BioD-like phosphotransacetylase family protein